MVDKHDDEGGLIGTPAGRAWIPRPDPTLLTTQQLLREVAALKELFETRLDAMDKAIMLLQTFADKSPTTVSVANSVESLKELVSEKFSSVDIQFMERDKRREQTDRCSKDAIEAALASSKEAVSEQNKSTAASINKSETAFTKQLDQIAELFRTTSKAMDEKIGDLKERITTIDGRSTGRGDVWGLIVGGAGLIVAALAVVAFVSSRPSPPPQAVYVPAPAVSPQK